MKRARRSDCPISIALDLLGDRWTLLVIRDLMFKGKHRFNELRHTEEGIASNILAERLKALEQAGIVTRAVAARNAGGVTYQLTEKGRDLAPVLVELILWSARHDPASAADRRFVQAARSNRDALLAEIANAPGRSG